MAVVQLNTVVMEKTLICDATHCDRGLGGAVEEVKNINNEAGRAHESAPEVRALLILL
jgi:hypothetical protein